MIAEGVGTGVRRGLLAAVVLGFALSAGGCSSIGNFFGKKDVEEADLPERPAGELYNEGLASMQRGNLKKAVESFEELDRQYPYTEAARKSQVMMAFASYRRGDYENAISASKRYLSLYPGTPDAAYAQYIIGMSYYHQIPVVTRDQQATREAMQAMQDIINNYPDSVYANDAREKYAAARDQLAGKEMQIGRYYQERREYVAAINRFKVVVTDYQTTPQVEEALYRIVEANMALGVVPEAQAAGAVLGHNFPNSQWYKRAHSLLQSGGVSPSISGDNFFTKALKKLTPGGSDEPKVQPKAPDPGLPAPEDLPAPKGGVPTAGRPGGGPLGLKG
jgi:outer membrane protein assembly factor BamD